MLKNNEIYVLLKKKNYYFFFKLIKVILKIFLLIKINVIN
jgi:hypothetical protein